MNKNHCASRELPQDCCQPLPNFIPGEPTESWQARYDEIRKKSSNFNANAYTTNNFPGKKISDCSDLMTAYGSLHQLATAYQIESSFEEIVNKSLRKSLNAFIAFIDSQL